jgi:hypothetical protein
MAKYAQKGSVHSAVLCFAVSEKQYERVKEELALRGGSDGLLSTSRFLYLLVECATKEFTDFSVLDTVIPLREAEE